MSQSTFDAIAATMATQQKKWNSGDIDGFMESYWKSDSLKFVSKKGVTYGWENTRANYHKSYPDKARMGILEFTIKSHELVDDNNVITIGQWQLHYPEAPTVGGYFTLWWKKMDGEWLIVMDHTS